MSYIEVWGKMEDKEDKRELTFYDDMLYGDSPVIAPTPNSNDDEEYIPPIKQIKSHMIFEEDFKLDSAVTECYELKNVIRTLKKEYGHKGGDKATEDWSNRQWIADKIIKKGGLTYADYIDESDCGGHIP